MFKNIHQWFADYCLQAPKRAALKTVAGPVHVVFTIVDHFEPRWGNAALDKELARARRFFHEYGKLVRRHADAHGVHSKYTFFYPIDEYTKECVDLTVDFCRRGYGELEVHLHHKDDTPDSLRAKLKHAVEVYKAHGLLSKNKVTQLDAYGFIHGNWSLCNSRRDGQWCGVNDELAVLAETGCYADFTLPSAPSDTQTAKINSIYYAFNSQQPKAHNTGVDVTVGRKPSGDLMIVQGPLMLDWRRRKIENGALASSNPVTAERIRLWLEAGVHVKGRPEWRFIKIHNHGCRDDHLTDKFFANLDQMFTLLEGEFNDGKRYQLHYATAREMYNMIKAAEEGQTGDPSHYRDYRIISNIQR